MAVILLKTAGKKRRLPPIMGPGTSVAAMEKNRKINAKKFVADFRAGLDDSDLMRDHGLDKTSLAKVFKALIAKGFLEISELEERKLDGVKRSAASAPPQLRQQETYAEPIVEKKRQDPDLCPQCGAKVNKKALTCPECGHVLSGEQRWADVEPKQHFWERIPPLALGCIIALPIGVMMFFLFRDIILPMSQSAADKRAEALRRELPKGKAPMEAAKDLARIASHNIIKSEVERLVGEEILASTNASYTAFNAGPRWADLSEDERMRRLKGIRTALRSSGLPVNFRFLMETGEVYATVSFDTIQVNRDLQPQDSGFPTAEPNIAPQVEEEPAEPPQGPRMPTLPSQLPGRKLPGLR